ncbi:MAG: SH3 domain-containing protein [Lachnospiraceae bacterium]|nr:SH3 domain-containing protein [Lachnospiraceae bacterium]
MYTRLQRGIARVQAAKKGVLAALLVCVMSFQTILPIPGVLVPAYGYTAVKGTVTARSGFVRKEASTSSSCVFCVSKGDEVIVLGEKKGSDGRVWYQIQLGGSTGYIRSDLVSKSNIKVSVPAANTDTQTASTQLVNTQTGAGASSGQAVTGSVKRPRTIVRKSSSTASDVVTVLEQGKNVTVTGSKTGEDGSLWYVVGVVNNASAYSGYIRADLLSVNGTVPTPSQAALTAQQTAAQADLTATITQAAAAAATQQYTAGAVSASIQVGKTKGSGVNIRELPVSGNVVANVSSGLSVTVTEFVRGEDGNIWCKIAFIYNKTPSTGYIRSDFLEGINLVNPEG